MSADNGIYILSTLKGKGHEYRVAHLQAVENYEWDDKIKGYTEDPDVQIKNAREMWDGCKVFKKEKGALKLAHKLADDVDILEYGICYVYIPYVYIPKEF